MSNLRFTSAVTGTGPLTLANTGKADGLQLLAVSTYTGGTTISGTSEIQTNFNGAIPTGSAVTINTGASLKFVASSTIGSLAGGGNVFMNGSNALTAGGDNTSTTFSGVYQNSGGAAALTKAGTGTLTLSGVNTYTGATTVNAGTLAVTGSIVSPVTVNSGGTLVGTGTISNTVTVNSGGTLSPGLSPGVINTGNVTLTSGSTLTIELNGTTVGTQYDQVNVTGTVDLGNATLNVVLGFVPSGGQVFTIINNDSSDAVTGTFAGLGEGSTFTLGGRAFRVSYVGGDGNDVTLTALGADLAVTKSGPATITAGNNITYNVSVTNNGPSDAQSVTLSDTLPAGTTFVSEAQNSGPAFTCTNPSAGGTGSVSCTLGTLASGASATFTLIYKVGANVANNTTLTNTASVSSSTTDATPGNNSQATAATVNASADLAVTKSGPATITAGNNITYNVSVINNGPSDAQNVTLSDTLPAGTTFVSETQNTGPAFNCTNPSVGATGTVSCTIGTLASGASATFTLVFKVAVSTAGGTIITNTASASSATTDPTPGNNSQSTSATVSASADLAVTKSGPATITAGNNITYSISLTNNGPSDAQSVTLSDTLPSGTTFVSETQNTGPAFTCTNPSVGGTGSVSCTIGTLANGASATFTLVFKVNNNVATGSTITNTASASSATTDPTPANNSQSSSATVNASADLAVTKSGPATITAGNNITYNVSVTNNGPSDAQSVTLSDTLPAGTTFVSETQNTGPAFTCTNPSLGGTGSVSCTLATLTSGASATFTLVFKVGTNFANNTTLTNTASASSSTSDPTPVNNSASTSATVIGINHAPVNHVPGSQTAPLNGTLVFSAANGNLIFISDVDAGSDPVQVTLRATDGTLTLSTTSGLSFTVGDGTDDPLMTFTGSIANINAALNGMSNLAFGSGVIEITTNDLGHNGVGGALSATDTIAVTVIDNLAPVLLTIPGSDRAIAFESVTFVIDPFSLQGNPNFSADFRTRIILFALHAQLRPGEDASAVTAEADVSGTVIPLTVESVRTVPNFDWLTQVVVKLPDRFSTGGGGPHDAKIRIRLRGQTSNQAVITVVPAPAP